MSWNAFNEAKETWMDNVDSEYYLFGFVRDQLIFFVNKTRKLKNQSQRDYFLIDLLKKHPNIAVINFEKLTNIKK